MVSHDAGIKDLIKDFKQYNPQFESTEQKRLIQWMVYSTILAIFLLFLYDPNKLIKVRKTSTQNVSVCIVTQEVAVRRFKNYRVTRNFAITWSWGERRQLFLSVNKSVYDIVFGHGSQKVSLQRVPVKYGHEWSWEPVCLVFAECKFFFCLLITTVDSCSFDHGSNQKVLKINESLLSKKVD